MTEQLARHPLATIRQQLADRFPDNEIKHRQGRGKLTFSYIDARAVEDRLDATAGPENWSDRYEPIGDPAKEALQCFLTVHGVTKCGVGYPNSEGDEEPLKAAESDALKRAAVKFGIGRFLYSMSPGRNSTPTTSEKPTDQQPARGSNPGQAVEPSTSQLDYLKRLADQHNLHIDTDQLTRREASKLIDEITAGDLENPRITPTPF